jgi:hypothetical protein
MPSRGAGSQHSVAAKDGKKKGTAAGKAAAGQKGNGSLLGVRVRVQCSDGAFYEGKVTGWDPALAEWQILLDDGEPCDFDGMRSRLYARSSCSCLRFFLSCVLSFP